MKISKETQNKLKTHIISLLDESLFIDFNKKLIYNNHEECYTFSSIDNIIKQYKNVNVIHKPIWLILYTKLKNNQLSEIKFSKILDYEGLQKQISNYKVIK